VGITAGNPRYTNPVKVHERFLQFSFDDVIF